MRYGPRKDSSGKIVSNLVPVDPRDLLPKEQVRKTSTDAMVDDFNEGAVTTRKRYNNILINPQKRLIKDAINTSTDQLSPSDIDDMIIEHFNRVTDYCASVYKQTDLAVGVRHNVQILRKRREEMKKYGKVLSVPKSTDLMSGEYDDQNKESKEYFKLVNGEYDHIIPKGSNNILNDIKKYNKISSDYIASKYSRNNNDTVDSYAIDPNEFTF